MNANAPIPADGTGVSSRPVPKSKSKRSRYTPPPRKKAKPSPKWLGVLILGVMGLGVALIVGNYMGLIPGTNGQASQIWLFGGLGSIALGFLLATQWR
jgi:cell division protein CrgA